MGELEIKKIEFMESILDYNDKHLGETIYIIGNSEELYYLTDLQKKTLENKITIGVNYSHTALKLKYLTSGHPSHVFYAFNYSKDKYEKLFYQGERSSFNNEKGIMDKVVLTVNNVSPINKDFHFPRTLKNENSKMTGANNISLSATCLAHIMGAKKIIFIGFDQKKSHHFYDLDSKLREQLRTNIKNIKEKYLNKPGMQGVFNDFNHFLSFIDTHEHNKNIKYKDNYLPIFKKMFDKLKQTNIGVYSTCKESLLTDSGAEYMHINKALKL